MCERGHTRGNARPMTEGTNGTGNGVTPPTGEGEPPSDRPKRKALRT